MKCGLVLEGGAMRGMYTAGVLDVFMDNGVRFDGIVGVSAGALFGVNFLSGQKGRVIRYNSRFNSDKNYIGVRPLLREGNIINTKYAYEDVPRRLDPFDNETYKRAAETVPFYAVITSCETGKPEYVRITDVFEQMDTLRASGSMPFVSKPVVIDGRRYLDGGISDSIPYEWMMEQGYDKVVVVLTRDMSYRKEPASRSLVRLRYGTKTPLGKTILERYAQYNDAVEKLKTLEDEGRVFVIRPTVPIDIDRMEKDPHRLHAVYKIGCDDAEENLLALHDYLR